MRTFRRFLEEKGEEREIGLLGKEVKVDGVPGVVVGIQEGKYWIKLTKGLGRILVEAEDIIQEGTWEFPFTTKDAKKLQDIMKKSLPPGEGTTKLLYHIFGDDDLFDRIDDAKGKVSDVRGEVKARLREMLKMYEKNPGSFKHRVEDEALEILKKIAGR